MHGLNHVILSSTTSPSLLSTSPTLDCLLGSSKKAIPRLHIPTTAQLSSKISSNISSQLSAHLSASTMAATKAKLQEMLNRRSASINDFHAPSSPSKKARFHRGVHSEPQRGSFSRVNDVTPDAGCVLPEKTLIASPVCSDRQTPPAHQVNDFFTVESHILGAGQFGTVRLCVCRRTRTRFACKSIPKARLTEPSAREDVQREVLIM